MRFRERLKTVLDEWRWWDTLGSVGLVVGVALLVAIAWYSLTATPKASRQAGDPSSALKEPNVVGAGVVTDEAGYAISNGVVELVILNAEGAEVSRHVLPMGPDGVFRIHDRVVPGIRDLAGALVVAESPSYRTRKANVMLKSAAGTGGTATLTVHPREIRLPLQAYNPAIVLVLFFPAAVGIVMVLLHVTGYSRSVRVSQLFGIGSVVLWSSVVLWIAFLYSRQRNGVTRVPLFADDFVLSTEVALAAVVGTFIYVAYSMYEKDVSTLRLDPEAQQRVLLAIGGRVLVAPYVAVIGHGILATAFPAVRGGAEGVFFGFFTGLWIKPVLEALNDIGLRFLSAEKRQAIVDRLHDETRRVVQPTTSAEMVRAEAAFIEAVREARTKLLELDGVIGVGAGTKIKLGVPTGQRAVVVYVYSKKDLAPTDPQAVPTSIGGIPTDVQVITGPPSDGGCHSQMLDVSPEKIWRDQQSAGIARSVAVQKFDGVPCLIDNNGSLYFGPPDADNKRFVIRAAYEEVRTGLPDDFDLVAFVMDGTVGVGEGYYYRPIFNDVDGIGFYWDRSAVHHYDLRSLWRVQKLRGVLVFSRSLKLKTCLHEIGHAWSSYIRYSSPSSMRPLLDPSEHHWHREFDYGTSCMADSFEVWQRRADGLFVRAGGTTWTYSPLDLYLMGLIPIGAVPTLRFLGPHSGSAYREVDRAEASDLVRVAGQRRPAPSSGTRPPIRLGLVVVAATEDAARDLAAEVRTFCPELERAFAKACTFAVEPANPEVLATLSTAM